MGRGVDHDLFLGDADSAGLWLYVVDASGGHLGEERLLRGRLWRPDHSRCPGQTAGGRADS